jgi:hypothetical protein
VQGQISDRWVEFVDAVQGEGCGFEEAGVQFGGVQAVPHGVPARGHRGVPADQQRLAVAGEPHARRLQAMAGEDVGEVVQGHQSGDVERAGYVAVFAVQCLGEEVLAQARRDAQIRHRVRAPDPSVVAVTAAGAAAPALAVLLYAMDRLGDRIQRQASTGRHDRGRHLRLVHSDTSRPAVMGRGRRGVSGREAA